MTVVIKEYFNDQIEMRGPGNWNAKPTTTGTTCILRLNGGQLLNGGTLAEVFGHVGRDFPGVPASNVTINARENRVEVVASPPPGYKGITPRTIGARG